LKNRLFGGYSANLNKTRVGCPMEGTFGIICGAFEVFGLKKMYPKVSKSVSK